MRLGKFAFIAILASVGLVTASFAADAPAAPAAPTAKAPLIVEMFTSKYCPNCPMAEAKMRGVAADNPDLLVLFEHVDYWDRSETQKDPHGLAEITQRQYDYSNTLSKRPGQVFTPMPLINGQIVANPPLMFSWGSALARGRELPAVPVLSLSKGKDGALTIPLPATLRDASNEIWVMGIEPADESKVWRVTGISRANLKGSNGYLSAAMMPKGEDLLVLVQKQGPGAVLAYGRL